MQAAILVTIQSFCTYIALSQMSGPEELAPKEGPFLQESLNIERRAKHLSPFFTGASSQAKSDHSSGEEVDLDLASEADEAIEGRHLFGLDNLEGLLQAVYATKEILGIRQDVQYRGLVKTLFTNS